MPQHYSDPRRESDPHALPDLEVFYLSEADVCAAEADTWIADMLTDLQYAPDAARQIAGWYYWYCFPGCLPDSDPCGPFATEADALQEARLESAWYGEEEDQDHD